MAKKRRARGASRVHAQHRELRAALDVIQETAELSQLVPLLEDLRSDLAAHFADEEGKDGLAEAIGGAAPWHLRRLDGLMREHRLLLATLDELIAQGRTLLRGPASQIVRGSRDLARRLREHEAQETELLSDAVHADIGSG